MLGDFQDTASQGCWNLRRPYSRPGFSAVKEKCAECMDEDFSGSIVKAVSSWAMFWSSDIQIYRLRMTKRVQGQKGAEEMRGI